MDINLPKTMKTINIISFVLASCLMAADDTDLIRLYEEEILAHDLYVELAKTHDGIMPLRNIPRSEARHRDAMAGILKQEGIALPTPAKGRRFVSEGLDGLFDAWLKEGRKSPAEACRVGVRLEEYDIADLRKAQRDFPDHKQVLGALENASNNHLRAFYRNLTSRGGDYAPEVLKGPDFKSILSSKGGGKGKGGGCVNGCGARGKGRAR